MATLTRPRISVKSQDSDEAARLLSLDIPTPFPRLPARTEHKQSSEPANVPSHDVYPTRHSVTFAEQHVEMGGRADQEEEPAETAKEAERTDSVSNSFAQVL